jgi:GrpB-like predicted nucleotidyltransferase (UPF0157 family)
MDEIEVVSADPGWPQQYAAERARLLVALAPATVSDIAHIGSTAIAGMPAKPIIDILIAVPSLSAARETFPALLAPLGYLFWAENPATDRLFFVRGLPPHGERRTHHLHVCTANSDVWTRHLAFRDVLRVRPDEAAAYAALKTQLAHTHREDREGYTRAKEGFIAHILALASAT